MIEKRENDLGNDRLKREGKEELKLMIPVVLSEVRYYDIPFSRDKKYFQDVVVQEKTKKGLLRIGFTQIESQ